MMIADFLKNKRGSVSTEASFLLMIMVALTGATVEAGFAYFQWNSAQQAARHGARLAATSDPVAQSLSTMTGLGDGVEAGDPMPDYTRECSGKTRSCNEGGFSNTAMNNIVFGPDNDLTCGTTEKKRRGMCDVFDKITIDNVDVTYTHSGLGIAGNPGQPAPLVTVKVTDMRFNFVFLGLFTPKSFSRMPDVSVSLMAEDLRSGR